jgi:hypothetical protein
MQIGFKVFLNITPTVTNWTTDGKQFSLTFEENPLADFVELPDDGRAQNELWYSNLLCGVLRGSLEMVSYPCLLLNLGHIRDGADKSLLSLHFLIFLSLCFLSLGALMI